MRIGLPLPRFIFNPLTLAAIATVHLYLSVGHLSHLSATLPTRLARGPIPGN
jgi:hypothetical protein